MCVSLCAFNWLRFLHLVNQVPVLISSIIRFIYAKAGKRVSINERITAF
jgi:hypothetical protein